MQFEKYNLRDVKTYRFTAFVNDYFPFAKMSFYVIDQRGYNAAPFTTALTICQVYDLGMLLSLTLGCFLHPISFAHSINLFQISSIPAIVDKAFLWTLAEDILECRYPHSMGWDIHWM